MRRRLFPFVLLVCLPAVAAENTDLVRPPPRMHVDESPTQFACTMQRVLRGEECTFEFEPAERDPDEAISRENSRHAGSVSRSCAEAATPPDNFTPDAMLRRMCEDDVARLALTANCTLLGRFALVDRDGRMAAQGKACLEELARVLSHTRTQVAVSVPCCRCLSQARCGVSKDQCKQELFDLAPGDELMSCLRSSCQEQCSSTFLTAPADDLAPPAPRNPSPKARQKHAADEATRT